MNRLILQSKQLTLHKRATCLLELLKAAQSRQVIFENDLIKWRSDTSLEQVRLMSTEEDILIKISRLNDIQKRILKSYHWLIVDLYIIAEDFMLPINLLHF